MHVDRLMTQTWGLHLSLLGGAVMCQLCSSSARSDLQLGPMPPTSYFDSLLKESYVTTYLLGRILVCILFILLNRALYSCRTCPSCRSSLSLAVLRLPIRSFTMIGMTKLPRLDPSGMGGDFLPPPSEVGERHIGESRSSSNLH